MKTIIVMGKGRGGTTLIANILKEAGVDLGKNLKGPIPINPKGCFENLEILTLTQKMLRDIRCAGTLDNLDTKNTQKKIFTLKNKYNRIIKKVVKNNESELWGWKDERNCFVIKLFLPYLVNPHFVVVHRNMLSIAKSLESADGTPIGDGLLSSIASYKTIFEFLKETNYPVHHISYDSLFGETKRKSVRDMCKFVGVKYKSSFLNIIDNKLRHHV